MWFFEKRQGGEDFLPYHIWHCLKKGERRKEKEERRKEKEEKNIVSEPADAKHWVKLLIIEEY